MLIICGSPVRLLAGGLLADRFGIRVVYVLGGALLLAAAACGRWLSHTSTHIPWFQARDSLDAESGCSSMNKRA